MSKNRETTGRKDEGVHFSATEVLLMKALVVAKYGKLDTGFASLNDDAMAPAGAAGVKKAFSSRALTHNTLAAVAGLLELAPDELAFRVKRGAGIVALGSGVPASVDELRAKDLAYRVWVQLTTRVLAHPIDWNVDDLEKVYDSWNEAFLRIRELLEEAALWRDTDTALATEILREVTDLLNGTLRPHLTTHQSNFRHWLDSDEANTDPVKKLPPPARQKRFPGWVELAADFVRTQQNACTCRDRLHGRLFPQASTAARRQR